MLIFSCLSLSFTTFFLVLVIEPSAGCPVEKLFLSLRSTQPSTSTETVTDSKGVCACICVHVCGGVLVGGWSQGSINIHREITRRQTSRLSSMCAYTDLQTCVLWNIETMSELDCPSQGVLY